MFGIKTLFKKRTAEQPERRIEFFKKKFKKAQQKRVRVQERKQRLKAYVERAGFEILESNVFIPPIGWLNFLLNLVLKDALSFITVVARKTEFSNKTGLFLSLMLSVGSQSSPPDFAPPFIIIPMV